MSDDGTTQPEVTPDEQPEPQMSTYEAQPMRKEYLGRALEQRGDKSISEVVDEVRTLVEFVMGG